MTENVPDRWQITDVGQHRCAQVFSTRNSNLDRMDGA
jgi:hypothetical protein